MGTVLKILILKKKFIQEEFYKFCEQQNKIILFVPWFVSTYLEQYISVLERNYKLRNGNVLNQVYPPQQFFQIERNDKVHNFLAFAKLLEDDTL